MDDDFAKAIAYTKAIAEKPETQVTLKLPLIITIFGAVVAALFGGYVTNRIAISDVKTDYKVAMVEQQGLKSTLSTLQAKLDAMNGTLTEIRLDQIRRYKKEK